MFQPSNVGLNNSIDRQSSGGKSVRNSTKAVFATPLVPQYKCLKFDFPIVPAIAIASPFLIVGLPSTWNYSFFCFYVPSYFVLLVRRGSEQELWQIFGTVSFHLVFYQSDQKKLLSAFGYFTQIQAADQRLGRITCPRSCCCLP